MSLFTTKNETATPDIAARRSVTPRYHVRETANAFTVTAYLPGVDRSALETQLDGENLTVVARRTWTPPTDWTPVYRETASVDYQLVLRVDERVNRDAVRAELTQGVLTLTLPKSESVKPRRIEIQG
jgi:HSP20 family protein